MKVLKDLAVSGSISVGQFLQSSINTDKFLVSESGVVKFRSGSQLLGDIGAASSGHTHTFASLTSKPTTLSGYGITDAVNSATTITINGTTYDLSANRSWTITASETDTLATVTGRGASTSTAIVINNTLAVGHSSHYDSAQFSLDINGGLIVKNTGKTAQLILINANPASGGNAGFVQHAVGGTLSGAFASIQTYYGTSVAAGTLQLQPSGGTVTIGGSTVFHAGNYTTYSPTLTGSGASGTWAINITGSAGSVAWANVTGRPTALSSFTNDLGNYGGWITGYTETDTLQSVTNRGATTTASISAANFQNAYQVLSLNNIKTPGLYNYDGGITGTQPLSNEWYNVRTIELGADSRYSQFVMPYNVDRIFYRRKSDAGFAAYVELYHTGNLTNLNQLTNGPGYITGYTETDTLASVTGRGASTSTASIFSSSLAVGHSSHYDSAQFSLDVNGGLLIKNTGKTAQLILQNANPAAGGNAGFVQHLVGGTTTGAFASIQTYYGTSVAAGTLQLQPSGGIVTIGGSTVYHTGNLPTIPTNNNQLTNGANYITASSYVAGLNLQGLGNGSMNVNNAGSAVYRNENGNGGNLSYAPVLHLGGGDTMWQIQGDYSSSTDLRWRAGYQGTWYAWRQILHSANYNSYSPTLTGTGASGTWGISITGNAATVGGYGVSGTVGANTVVIRDVNGYIYAHYINSNVSETENPTINSFYTSNGDGWLRKSSLAHVRSQLGNYGSWITSSSLSSYLPLSGGTLTGNLYIQSGGNPTQFNLRGTNPELYVDAAYGGGTARLIINRGSTSNQATLHFTTGTTVTNGTAWNNLGAPLWTMGMTNTSQTSDFKLAYGDIYDANAVAFRIDTNRIAYFTNTPYVGANVIATQSWVASQGYSTSSSAAWSGITGKPSHIMYYQSFTLDANTMDVNATGFTYSVNAPFTGPIARFSAGGSYDLWLGGNYGGGGNAFYIRTRNGDAGTFNSWRQLITDGNIGSQSVSSASTVTHYASRADGTWYNVVWAAGNPSHMYSSDAVMIRSSDGTIRANVFYDNQDTGYYLDPNGTSNLNKLSGQTMAYNDMNPMSANSPYAARYGGSAGYRNGTMGYGQVSFNEIFSNWGSGFIDSWSSPGNAPGGSSHYVGHQVAHYNHQNSTNVYGYQMVCAGEADNRFFWRSSWATPRGWVEMIHSGNIGGQKVDGAMKLWAESHPSDYYVRVNWTGSHWYITSNHPSPVRVGYADTAGSAPANGGTSSNTNSISSATGGAYTWTGINYFETNQGGQAVNNSNSAKLQAYSSGNNSAFMSFHRGGYYAVNFGLDDDNVMRIGGWSAGANRWQLDMSGNMTVAGDVTAYSDARVKTNIKTIENALDKVLGLRGVSYTRTDSQDIKTKIGVIAQETLPIVPEVVNQDNDGMYNVSYGNFGGLFIEAFKAQQLQIEDLKKQIEYLVENK